MRSFLESEPPLTQLRMLCRVTQEALAAAAGVARSTIASIEAHRAVPTHRTCARLAAPFSLTARDMTDVLSGHVRVSSIAHRVKWGGPAADVMPQLEDGGATHTEAIDHALMALVHGQRPSLRDLDTVRRWLSEIGSAEAIGKKLATESEEWIPVVAKLLLLAKDQSAASLDGPMALWRLLARELARDES